MITLAEVLARTTAYLAERGIRSARLDAEILLAHGLGVERITLYTDFERPLSDAELANLRGLVARRGRREPVAYITGVKGFRRLELTVTPDVLVPRPETEHLVEWASERAPAGASVLDWGTGSGAVALALADERPDLRVTGIDCSEAALAVARANGAEVAVEFVRSDGFSALWGRRFDVIAANPPYLTSAELRAAGDTELGHEPAGALASGASGFEAIETILTDAPGHLVAGGWLLLEVGDGQARAVADRMRAEGYLEVETRNDLAGIPRNVGGRAA